ncbi:ATP-dependent nuclease [Vibrio splendidus]|uniref:ATP-dependent nuclease n=1 Tax=Vibrio splendidus TaxID=29497 RepID=UPI000C817819|nr:AAA family ATPase [Vibrio splendidus]PMK40544.1 hypothetical protein BCU01_17745 [Vibrio splendidus]PMO17693.1 hypothetical protein BCT15_23010 [Vibrio splendidus]
MQLEHLRIKNFRTIGGVDQHIDLTQGLTIVGPNSSGKTNILKAIQMLFTGYDNELGYDIKRDLTFGVSNGQTSLAATFSGNRELDNEFFILYDELNSMLEEPKELTSQVQLYLSFAKSGKPMYRFFSNDKMKKELQTQFSRKQMQAVSLLLSQFVCHYVPSSKSTSDLYSSLLLPFLKRSVTRVLADKVNEINIELCSISSKLDKQLEIAGLGGVTSHFSLPNESLEELIAKFEFHLSDPAKTSIEHKGMGIQAAAIIASFLWITEEEKKLNKNTIWLIEEPESYLHPQLADSCHKMLEKLRHEALLVTTTHSLGFVHQDPKKVVGTSIEKEFTKVTTYETYHEATSSIRSALGVRFSDFYNLGLLNIFVEGKTDREIFQWFLKLSENQRGFEWPHVRSAVFCDFSGVSGIEGFMKATYEFIHKERPVVTVLDGDTAGDYCRRNLQQYFGKKQISFQPNVDFICLPVGFAVEGLFPHEWIIELYKEHDNWFDNCSYDLKGALQPFTMKSNKTKEQLRNNVIRRALEQDDLSWAEDFKLLFDQLESQLARKHEKVYGALIPTPVKPPKLRSQLRTRMMNVELEPKETEDDDVHEKADLEAFFDTDETGVN